MDEEKGLIEAMLFLEVEPIELRVLARASGISIDQVTSLIGSLQADLEKADRGVELIEVDGTVHLSPKKTLWPRLRERYGKRREARLSRAAMETLSIIAYSQPITRAEVESLRGVAADAMMRQLLEKGFVKEVGRKQAPGQPIQYGTTRDFLHHFGLQSIADLPKLSELEQERFRLNG